MPFNRYGVILVLMLSCCGFSGLLGQPLTVTQLASDAPGLSVLDMSGGPYYNRPLSLSSFTLSSANLASELNAPFIVTNSVAGGTGSVNPTDGVNFPSFADVYFRVRASATGALTVVVSPPAGFSRNMGIAVYNSAAFASLESQFVQASDIFRSTGFANTIPSGRHNLNASEYLTFNATSGSDYVVRIFQYNTTNTGTVQVSLFNGAPAAGDMCSLGMDYTGGGANQLARVQLGTCNFPFNVLPGTLESYPTTVAGCIPSTPIQSDGWVTVSVQAGQRVRVDYNNSGSGKDAGIVVYRTNYNTVGQAVAFDCGTLLAPAGCANAVLGEGTESVEFSNTGGFAYVYAIRVANLSDNQTMSGFLCVSEVIVRDVCADAITAYGNASLAKLRFGDCNIRADVLSSFGATGTIASCGDPSGADAWVVFQNTTGSAINARFEYAPDDASITRSVAIYQLGASLPSPASAFCGATMTPIVGTCRTAGVSNSISFTATAGTYYAVRIAQDPVSGVDGIRGSMCLYDQSKRAEDYFFSAVGFNADGSDCGKPFNILSSFDTGGGLNDATTSGAENDNPIVSSVNCPGATSIINDAWGYFDVSGAFPGGGLIVELDNNNNQASTANDVLLQVYRGESLPVPSAAGTTTNTGCITTGTVLPVNAQRFNVSVPDEVGSVFTGGAATTTFSSVRNTVPVTNITRTIRGDTWLRYTHSSTQPFSVILDNAAADMGLQIYTGASCSALVVASGTVAKTGDAQDPTVILPVVNASAQTYYIRVVNIRTSAGTVSGDIRVMSLAPVSCIDVLDEGVEAINLSASNPGSSRYYVRGANTGNTALTTYAKLCIRPNVLRAADLCTNAQQVLVGDCDLVFNLDNTFTQNSTAPSCVASTAAGVAMPPTPVTGASTPALLYDGWLRFTATSSLTTVEYSATSGTVSLAVYRGSCGGLIFIGCVTMDATTRLARIKLNSIAGLEYYVQVIASGGNLNGRYCITNATERDICSDTDLVTRVPGDCNIQFDVPGTFAATSGLGMRNFTASDGAGFPVTEVGGSTTQFTASSCENAGGEISRTGEVGSFNATDNNPGIGNPAGPNSGGTANANARDAWFRLIGNGNDVTLIYQTTGTNANINPAIVVYTALRSVGPVNCGSGLDGAGNPRNQYACANRVTTNGQQTEALTFRTNGGQIYLVRIMNLGGVNASMTGVLCVSDGAATYDDPVSGINLSTGTATACGSSTSPARKVDIGRCNVPLNVITPQASNGTRCYIPASNPTSSNYGGNGTACADCNSTSNANGDAWAVFDYIVCDPTAAPAPVAGTCASPYIYDSGNNRCLCPSNSIPPITSGSPPNAGNVTVQYDNRDGLFSTPADAKMTVYEITSGFNCSNGSTYSAPASGATTVRQDGTNITGNTRCVNDVVEGVETIIIRGLPFNANTRRTFLVRVTSLSGSRTLFGNLCISYGSSLGSQTCPPSNDYGALDGEFRRLDVAGGTYPVGGQNPNQPTQQIPSCLVPVGSLGINTSAPVRSQAWTRFTVPSNATYTAVTVQYDNSGFGTSVPNAAIAVYNGTTAANCNAQSTGNPSGLPTTILTTEGRFEFCANTVYIGTESLSVPVLPGNTYFVRVMNIQNNTDPANLSGRLRIFPYAQCNLGAELVDDGDFGKWPGVVYCDDNIRPTPISGTCPSPYVISGGICRCPQQGYNASGGTTNSSPVATYRLTTPNNDPSLYALPPTTSPLKMPIAEYDRNRNRGVSYVPTVSTTTAYPNDLDRNINQAYNPRTGVLEIANTGMARFATDYGFARDRANSDNDLPNGSSVNFSENQAVSAFYSDFRNTTGELSNEGRYTIKYSPFTLKSDWFCYGLGFSGYGGRLGGGEPQASYCATGAGGFGKEPCVSYNDSRISGGVTTGAYNPADGVVSSSNIQIDRPSAPPANSSANHMIINGSWDSSRQLFPGKVWCQTINRGASAGQIGYYIFTLWVQNMISTGRNLDVPQIRLTVCDMENPDNPGAQPPSSENVVLDPARPSRTTYLPGLTEVEYSNGSSNSFTNPPSTTESIYRLDRVYHYPTPPTNRVKDFLLDAAFGAAMPCNRSGEPTNKRLKILGSSFIVTEDPDQWTRISCIYRAPAWVTEMNICVENLSLTKNGNDIGVDQIGFRECVGADQTTFDRLLKGDPCELSDNPLGQALPLTYLDFAGKLIGDKVYLDWIVANERDVLRYDVQRSVNGTSFSTIGSVDAKGGSANTLAYNLTDKDLPVGAQRIYYRIKSYDRGGREQLSMVIEVLVSGLDTFELQLSPNPITAGEELMLSFNAPAGQMGIGVYDMLGQPLMQRLVQVGSGEQRVSLATKGMASGVYIVRLWQNGKAISKRLVVL